MTLCGRCDVFDGALGAVIGQDQAAVIEEALQGVAVIVSVLEGGANESPLVLERRSVLLEPGKEGEHVRAEKGCPQLLDFCRRLLLPRLVELEDATEPHEPLAGDVFLASAASQKRRRA
jgi:hypothetical protein